jgi:membrane protein required for colicin V production
MNWLDIILGVLLAFAVFRGFKNGIFIEVASIAALVLGVWIAVKFSGLTEVWISDELKWDSNHLELVAFIITFILVVVLVHIVAKLADKLFKAIALGLLTRLSGMVVGLIKTAFILSILLVIVEKVEFYTIDIIPVKVKNNSILYSPVKKFAPNILPFFYKSQETKRRGDHEFLKVNNI